jgi:hypothetical protein
VKERIEELAREHVIALSVIKNEHIHKYLYDFSVILANEALEMAAKECDAEASCEGIAQRCAEAIRKLKV